MKVIVDASVIVEIERRNEEATLVMKKLVERGHEILISTVTISEILAGPYLRKDFKKSLESAKSILGQFLWIDMDAEIAEKTAQYIAYLVAEGKIIQYQDIAIAATFRETDADYLLTFNSDHFERLPDLKGKVFTPVEFAKILK